MASPKKTTEAPWHGFAGFAIETTQSHERFGTGLAKQNHLRADGARQDDSEGRCPRPRLSAIKKTAPTMDPRRTQVPIVTDEQ